MCENPSYSLLDLHLGRELHVFEDSGHIERKVPELPRASHRERPEMARKDALLRLHESLKQKRDALREKLAGDLNALGPSSSSSLGDICDEATEGAKKEIDSQLAALESRELTQIETAIKLIREGRYGLCEDCQVKIPIARLRALPYTPLCIECQRKRELMGTDDEDFDPNWESAYEYEGASRDRDITIGDLDVD